MSQETLPAKISKNGITFFALLIFSILIHALYMNRGWMSVDEGYFLAPVAAVAKGAIPNLHFQTNHPGLLFYWHLLLFKLFGSTILTTRISWFILAVGQSLLVFWISRRMLPLVPSILTTLLLIATGPLAYVTSNPNWIALFLLHVVIAGLFLWAESLNKKWLFGIGALLGITLLFKQSLGIYGFLATLFSICFRFLLSPSNSAAQKTDSFLWMATPIIITLLMSSLFLRQPETLVVNLFIFSGPLIFLSSFFYKLFLKHRSPYPLKEILILLGGFLTCCLVPICLLLFYQGVEATEILIQNIFIDLPKLVSETFVTSPPSLWFEKTWTGFLQVFPFALGALLFSKTPRKLALSILLLVLGYFIFNTGSLPMFLASLLWIVVLWLRPLSNWLAISALFSKPVDAHPLLWQHGFLTLLCFSIFCYWIIYPFAFFNYQIYGLGFHILLIASSYPLFENTLKNTQKQLVLAGVILSIIIAFWLLPGKSQLENLKEMVEINPFTRNNTSLSATSSEIMVPPEEAAAYQQLDPIVSKLSTGDADLLVLPDNPEVYFLTGKTNPLPYYYIFPAYYADAFHKINTLLDKGHVSMAILPNPQDTHGLKIYPHFAHSPEAIKKILGVIKNRCRFYQRTAYFDIYNCRR